MKKKYNLGAWNICIGRASSEDPFSTDSMYQLQGQLVQSSLGKVTVAGCSTGSNTK